MNMQLLNSDLEKEELKELFIRAIDSYFREHLRIDPSQLTDKSLKELIPKNLMIDQTYIANWSIPDYNNIVKKLLNNITINRLDPAVYHKYLNRIYNDQSVVLDRDTILEPISIGRKADRITFEGVRALLLNITGNYQPSFRYGQLGDGQGEATYGQQFLYNPITSRVEITQSNNGSMILRGETLFINCSWSSNTVTFTQREFGVFDSIDPNEDKMFIYIQFDPADVKTHTVGNDVPTASSSVNVCTL